jgi:radical SAM protein with 4Fe4S-binding SPASM domain
MARLGLSWGFVSNGLLLDGQAMERLAGTGLIAVTLSLDGPQPVHEWLRDGAGTYARTLESAALVRARAGIHLDIVSCATPRLLPLLDSFSTEILSLSPDSWRLFRIFPKGRARGRRDLLLNSLEFRGLLDWIARARPAFRRKKILLEASCDSWMPFERDLEVRSSPFFCRSGVQIASILADGGISGCSNNDPSLIQGNIMRDDFVTLWMNGFSFFRDPGLRQRGSCAHCTHFPRCQGGSLHSWKLEGASPEFCWEDDGLGV